MHEFLLFLFEAIIFTILVSSGRIREEDLIIITRPLTCRRTSSKGRSIR